MTIETFERYRGISANVKALQMEIDSLYAPISSPNGKTGETYSSTPGDPTKQAVHKILILKERLYQELTKQIELLEEIEAWFAEADDKDAEIIALIRMHYIVGLSWRQTNLKAYGYSDYHNARKKVFRYFGRE